MSLRIQALVLLWSLSAAAHAAPVLVDGDWVAARLDDPAVVLVDTSDADQYRRFHLPGALHLPYGALLKSVPAKPYATRLDDAELTRLLGDLGIRRTQHVVIYDDTGALNAGRLFWELERIGHPKVSVLDGGLVAWILQGRRVVNAPAERKPVAYGAAGGGRNNEATLADIRRAAGGTGPLLLDVRTQDEYAGDPRQPRSGHVPGARLWPWEQAVDGAGGFKRADTATLRQSLERAGVTDAKQPIIAYCRTGHRAAQTYLTLRSLGYQDVRLYANSMMEYATDPATTLKSGAVP